MRCAACGQENSEDSRFCGSCGGELLSAKPSEAQLCNRCGIPLEPNKNFCGNCGQPFAPRVVTSRVAQSVSPDFHTPAATAITAPKRRRRLYVLTAALGLAVLFGVVVIRAGKLSTKTLQDRFAVAQASLEIFLKSNNGSAYFDRGIAYYHLEQHERAMQDFSEAIRLESNPRLKATFHSARGDGYMRTRDYSRALEDYSSATKLNPEHGEYWAQLAVALWRQGRRSEADQAAREAIRLGDKNDPAYKELFGSTTPVQ